LKLFQEGAREDKGERWRGWIYLRYTVRTFVNVTMYPQYNNNMLIKIKVKGKKVKQKRCLP
jgi:hypothetical protein